MPFIQNVSRKAIEDGFHMDPGPNCMLIQISDPDCDHPVAKYTFKRRVRVRFFDTEDKAEQGSITDCTAEFLVDQLKYALENHMNVIVHCHAGLCRSGAVAEVGVMMGFQDAEAPKIPNLLVKTSMMRKLGWTYD